MRDLLILVVEFIAAALLVLKDRWLHYIRIVLIEVLIGSELLLIMTWFVLMWLFAPPLWFHGLFASLRPPTDRKGRVTAGRQVLP